MAQSGLIVDNGSKILEGNQTITRKRKFKQYLNEEVLLIDKSKAIGVVRVLEPTPQSDGWIYPIEVVKRFDVPLPVANSSSNGASWIPKVIFKEKVEEDVTTGKKESSKIPLLNHMKSFVVIPDFCSLTGGAVSKSEEVKDYDMVWRCDESLGEMETKFRNLLPEEMRKSIDHHLNSQGPHSDFIPVFDLVCQIKPQFKVTKIQEPKKSEEVIKQQEGNLDFKPGDSGTGVMQLHERGLTEDQTKLTKFFGWDPVELSESQLSRLSELVGQDIRTAYKEAQTTSSQKLGRLLNKIDLEELSQSDKKLIALVSPVSVHTDVRLSPKGKDYWEGGEGFTPGNQFMVNEFRAMSEGKEEGKILANFKLPTEMKKVVIRGPNIWLKVGDGKPKVFPPGAVGSTKEDWSRFFVIDKLKWEAGIQDEHFKEFKFDGKYLKGRWIFQYVPVRAGGRQWMISKPKDQTFKYEPLNKIESEEVQVSIKVQILKTQNEKRLVTGIVLVPDRFDAQNQILSEDVIEESAHDFVSRYNIGSVIGYMHNDFSRPIILVESWVAPGHQFIGGKQVKKGSWIITSKVDPKTWEEVKRGDLKGYSIGGKARVQKV